MKKVILLVTATIILSACNMQVKKNYKYVESVLGGSSIKEKRKKQSLLFLIVLHI